jgi:hypothetical protein
LFQAFYQKIFKKGDKYMKKLWIAFAIAMAALMVITSPALAWGGSDANAEVNCSDVDVTDDSPPVGTTITFSGTVTCTANAYNSKNYCILGGPTAGAESTAWVVIKDPEGNIVYSYSSDKSDSDAGWWFLCDASANADQVLNWSADVLVDMVGDYVATHGGEAYAEYGHWFLFWRSTDGYASDSCSSSRTVTSHANMIALTYSRPYLVIVLPDGSRHFFGSDGWGNPTTEGIVYTDGTWQVEIQDSTIVQLDGEWHRITYLDVDSQGNVTGRYGAGGSQVAEDIGLSQPITITKVG